MIQFFAPDIEETGILPESDSAHCVRVLRMKEGDTLIVIDGKGYIYDCRLLDANSKRAAVGILSKRFQPLYWGNEITIAVAPTKHMDRMEWMVEKLTEIGVNRIVPLLCRYSERKEIKVERLEKIAISAMKQSLKTFLPEITPMMPIEEFFKSDKSEQKYVAYCAPEIPRRLLSSLYKPEKSVTVLIGPEGDFSDKEIKRAIDLGYQPVTFGDCRLRTETAAIVACDTCQIINQIKTI